MTLFVFLTKPIPGFTFAPLQVQHGGLGLSAAALELCQNFSSQQTLPHCRLCMQVDFGGLGLGDGSSDLEHSIMLRQRSLSSRNSLEDVPK